MHAEPNRADTRGESTESVRAKSADFRLYLQTKLNERCKRNPKYSLRSFAQSLGIHHATLSHLLRGNRCLTERTLVQLGRKLNLSPEELGLYLNELRRSALSRKKKNPPLRAGRFKELSPDDFALISDWYNDALLELTRTKDFRGDPEWIAKKLKIATAQVHVALEKLLHLRLLELSPDGRWLDKSELSSSVTHDASSQAQKRYQSDLLEMGIRAMDTVPKSQRDNSSIMMAMNSKDIPEIKKRIQDFRRKLCAFVQRKDNTFDSVYALSLCFYPLSEAEMADGSQTD